MPDRLSEEELAVRAGQPRELVGRIISTGALAPGEGGRYSAGDVALVRLFAALEESGVALEDIAAGVVSGDLDYGAIGLYLGEPPPSSQTVAEVARRAGRSTELVVRLVGALGLPLPSPDETMRDDEAEMIVGLVHAWELLDDEELMRLARFEGDTMRRLAAANLRFFEELVRQRVLRMDLTWEEGAALVEEMGTRAAAFTRPLAEWLYGRHFESALIRYMADNTEEYLDDRGIRARPARRPPAIAFLDLTGKHRADRGAGGCRRRRSCLAAGRVRRRGLPLARRPGGQVARRRGHVPFR